MYTRPTLPGALLAALLVSACARSSAPSEPPSSGEPAPSGEAATTAPAVQAGAVASADAAVPVGPDEDLATSDAAPPPDNGLVNGEYAPAFTLPVIGGKGTWNLEDHVRKDGAGKSDAVIVAFMASWCGYCAKSLPTLKELETANAGRLAVVILSVDDDDASRAAEAAKIKAAGLSAPVLAADGPTRRAWLGDSKSIPRFYFLNKVGEILVQDHGFGNTVQPLMPKQVAMLLANPAYVAR